MKLKRVVAMMAMAPARTIELAWMIGFFGVIVGCVGVMLYRAFLIIRAGQWRVLVGWAACMGVIYLVVRAVELAHSWGERNLRQP